MAEFDVSAAGTLSINFGASGNEEILQNVAMIINSVVHSCPMDRGFAWDGSILDRPIHIIPTLLSSRLIAAVNRYEPRAQVVSVTYTGNADNGQIRPKVKVRIIG